MVKRYTILLLILAFSVPGTQSLFAQDADDQPHLSKIEKRATQKYFNDADRKLFRFDGTTEVGEKDTIDGNVLVVDGNLTISGMVRGDVVVLNGDVSLDSGALVKGNITSIDGSIRQNSKSEVYGNQLETHAKNLFTGSEWDDCCDDHYYPGYERRYYGPYSTLPMGPVDDSVILSYNRVQGVFLGWAIPKRITGKYRALTIHGFGGYGFKEKAWRYELGADRWFFSQTDYRFEVGGKVYDLTDTKDNWILTPWENSLSAILLHRDYQDYYRRSGYEFHASQNLSIYFKGTLAYRNDDYESVEKNTDWAIFGKRDFRDNPLIEHGNMRSLYGELYFDNRDNLEQPTKGWYAKLGIETSNSKLKSDFSFNQYLFELRRYQPLGRYERLDFRIKAATSEGEVPLQKLYQLGGIGTMRGFTYKSLRGDYDAFGGDRMLLANLEYNLDPRSWGGDFIFFDELRYIFFVDAGQVWNRADVSDTNSWSSGFSHLKLNDIHSNIGIAFSSQDGHARLSIAKRTDTNKNSVLLTFRLSKPF